MCSTAAASLCKQVNLRDAFGNCCPVSPIPAIRCKLVRNSDDGTPMFVEASDPVQVLPFAQTNVPPASLHTSQQSSPFHVQSSAASEEDLARTPLQALEVFCQAVAADANPSDNDSSLVGEVDVGR
jgi:hypothetical protein